MSFSSMRNSSIGRGLLASNMLNSQSNSLWCKSIPTHTGAPQDHGLKPRTCGCPSLPPQCQSPPSGGSWPLIPPLWASVDVLKFPGIKKIRILEFPLLFFFACKACKHVTERRRSRTSGIISTQWMLISMISVDILDHICFQNWRVSFLVLLSSGTELWLQLQVENPAETLFHENSSTQVFAREIWTPSSK